MISMHKSAQVLRGNQSGCSCTIIPSENVEAFSFGGYLKLTFTLEHASRACAGWCMRDRNVVDIARGTSQLDSLARAVLVIGMAIVFETTLTLYHKHALRVGTSERVFV